MNIDTKHHWEYCGHCESDVVICGTCGNNCCNGGYGEVTGTEPNTYVKCPDCPSAYDLQDKGKTGISEARKKQLAALVATASKQVKELTSTKIRKLAVSTGIYDCITDPYDKLKNDDNYSSVMIDLERFAKLIIEQCADVCVRKYANSDAISAQCGINFANDIKKHFDML